MDIENFLSADETVLYSQVFARGKKKGRKLIHTEKKVVFQRKLGRQTEFVNIPINNISFLSLTYKKYNLIKIIIGFFLLLIGIANISIIFISIPLIIIGIVVLVNGFNQKGVLIINNEICLFDFRKTTAQQKVKDFIISLSKLL